MTQVMDLVRKITEDLQDVDRALRPHPYARAFRDGRAPVEALLPFVGVIEKPQRDRDRSRDRERSSSDA